MTLEQLPRLGGQLNLGRINTDSAKHLSNSKSIFLYSKTVFKSISSLVLLYAQSPLCTRHLALLASDTTGSRPHGNGESLEGALGAVVVVLTADAVNVDGDASCLGERLQAVGDHLARQVAELLALQSQLHHGVRPVRQIDYGAAERLVQRRIRRAEAREACCGAQRRREGVT
jgi:hypothetical protein